MIARMKISPLQRADIPELSQFLINGFRVPATSPYFSHEVLSWKYFDGPDGPSEESSSSLIARAAGKIVGHIGICARRFIVSGDEATPVSTMHAIDWLGSSEHTGSGTFLMLQAIATSKTQYAVGGTAHAQAVFPKLGFEQKHKLQAYRKVLSPFHRLRMTRLSFFRKWAGVAKDAVSVWRSRTPNFHKVVELRPVSEFAQEIDDLQRRSSTRVVTCQRDHMLLNYFLRYPVSGFTGWTIHSSEGMIGYVLLNITTEGKIQIGKIVDCWLNSDDPSCWQAAVAAITDRLRAMSADHVTCYGTTQCLQAALESNGFGKAGESNVFVRDKQQSLPRDLSFGLSMLEADHAIL